MQNEFETQRAELTGELTALVIAGGDTAKVRDKLSKLEARETSVRQAAAEARQAMEAERAATATERGCVIALGVVRAIESRGFEVAELDLAQFNYLGGRAAKLDIEIASANADHVAATERVRHVQSQMSKLQDRASALSGLRLAGQSSDRDVGEALLIEKDLAVLRDAVVTADRNALACQVPQELLNQRGDVMRQLEAAERAVVLRALKTRAEQAEAEFLRSLRELVATSGVAHPGFAYTRSKALDRYVLHGVL